jgi:ribosomal-protein-alanine N-acetyltransferase
VLIARDARTAVGSAGFLGAPAASPEIELGYGVHPDYRNRGYATEATQALVAWALGQPTVRRVIAKCDPANTPSVRVLEKIGMARCGTDKTGMLLWEAKRERGG